MSVHFVEQEDARPLPIESLIPLEQILSHHEVCDPSNRAPYTVRQLRKVKTPTESFEPGLKARLNFHPDCDRLIADQPQCPFEPFKQLGVLFTGFVALTSNRPPAR